LRWLFGQASREIIELAMADLERDRKEMMEEGCSPLWIQLCLLWGASRSVVPIVWDGCLRALTECAKAAKLLRTIIGRR
jgi:hypothetical protein